MNLSKRYHEETGLHASYMSQIGSHKKTKTGLVYTRKYVWWMETQIKMQMAVIDNLTEQLEQVSTNKA